MRTGTLWTRLAAASGIGFAGVAVADYVIGAVKNFSNAAAVTSRASNSVWSTWVLLVGLAGVLLLWFTATSTARLREIEGGSRRVSTEHLAAGSAIAALLFLEVAVQFAGRTAASGTALGPLATALVNGPVLAFGAGVFVLAAGVVGSRAGAGIPAFSGVIARVSVLLGLALIAGGGLWLYRDYAWLNDTVFFAFVGWVFVRSTLGTFRWADLDLDAFATISLPPATRRPAAARKAKPAPSRIDDLDEDTFEVPSIVRRSRASGRAAKKTAPGRKAAASKKKTAPRKPAARKPAERKPAAPKPAPRRPVARPAPPRPEPEAETEAEMQPPTETLETLDLGGPEDEL